MIVTLLHGVLDVSSICNTRPLKLFGDFAFEELSCEQSVKSRTPMLRQIQLWARFVELSIEEDGDEQSRVILGIFICILRSPMF